MHLEVKMSDPVLEYLKSVKQDIREIKTDLSGMLEKHDKRIDDLEDSHAQMKGAAKVVIAVATTLSGLISWIVAHVWKV